MKILNVFLIVAVYFLLIFDVSESSEAPRATCLGGVRRDEQSRKARGIFAEPSDLSAEALAKGEAKNAILSCHSSFGATADPPRGKPRGFLAKEGEMEESMPWIVEMEDRCKTEFSAQLLAAVAKNMDGKIYVATQNYEIILREIAKIRGEQRDKDLPPHKFIMTVEDIQVQVGDGKIYMRFNPPDDDGVYNADFLLFLYRKNDTWKKVLNPGNFRFKKELTKTELQKRIMSLIAGLTFK